MSALRRAGRAALSSSPGATRPRPRRCSAPLAGLVLAGGGDVEPERYGAEPHPSVYGVDAERDATEFELSAAALALGVPTLAVCRGIQVLNVLRGGTIEPAPPRPAGTAHGDPATGPLGHPSGAGRARQPPGRGRRGRRAGPVHVAPPPGGGRASARAWCPWAGAPTGWSRPSSPPTAPGWFVAVQWHPEATAADDPFQQALFDAFAAEVRRAAARLRPC